MTEERVTELAIGLLENNIKQVEEELESVSYDEDRIALNARIRLYEHGIEALEKQIPKKPLNIEDKYWGCPCCYGMLMVRWIKYPNNPVPLEAGSLYCEDCGQAIDWSDEE